MKCVAPILHEFERFAFPSIQNHAAIVLGKGLGNFLAPYHRLAAGIAGMRMGDSQVKA